MVKTLLMQTFYLILCFLNTLINIPCDFNTFIMTLLFHQRFVSSKSQIADLWFCGPYLCGCVNGIGCHVSCDQLSCGRSPVTSSCI